jgi:methylase of polypeptide subunit release factors
MNAGELLARVPFGRCQSRVACGTLGDVPLLHSSLSRRSIDTVFFGPDSYRFASFLQREAHKFPRDARVVDVGTGTGVGAVALLQRRPDLRVVLSDISTIALRLARINLTASHMAADYAQSDGLLAVAGPIDVVIANPPYLGGGIGRTYRKGGGDLGAGLAIDWVQQAAQRLQPGGSILLYTGSAIVDGRDTVREAIVPALRGAGYDVAYEEVDTDIFGRTLWLPAYWNVDRIAAVTMVATKSVRGSPIDMRGHSG